MCCRSRRIEQRRVIAFRCEQDDEVVALEVQQCDIGAQPDQSRPGAGVAARLETTGLDALAELREADQVALWETATRKIALEDAVAQHCECEGCCRGAALSLMGLEERRREAVVSADADLSPRDIRKARIPSGAAESCDGCELDDETQSGAEHDGPRPAEQDLARVALQDPMPKPSRRTSSPRPSWDLGLVSDPEPRGRDPSAEKAGIHGL